MELMNQFLFAAYQTFVRGSLLLCGWGNPRNTDTLLGKLHYSRLHYTTVGCSAIQQSTQGVFWLFVWLWRVTGWTQATWRLHGVIELHDGTLMLLNRVKYSYFWYFLTILAMKVGPSFYNFTSYLHLHLHLLLETPNAGDHIFSDLKNASTADDHPFSRFINLITCRCITYISNVNTI